MTHRQAVVGLIVVAAVWGASFTVTKTALAFASPMVLLAVRFILAAALVATALRGLTRLELRAGVIIGLLFWGGFMFQTTGLEYTTPSRSAFITGLSVPLTPLIYFLVHREAPRIVTTLAVLLAVAGTLLLTNPEGGGLNRGDILTLGCAVLFAGQIVAAGHFARSASVSRLLVVELGLSGVLSLTAVPTIGTPRLELDSLFVACMVFLSVSAAATFYFQLRAQQVVSPAQTALIFALEPVFAALTSYIVIGETLSALQWLGGGLIVIAMLMAQVRVSRAELPAEGVPPA